MSKPAAKPAATPAPVALPPPADAGWPSFPRINVSGVEFQLSLAALRSQPGSLISDIYTGGEPADLDQFDRVFFERDPAPFATIASFLRTGGLIGAPAGAELEALRREATHYRLTALLALLPPSFASAAAGPPPPTGGRVFAKWLQVQTEMNGELAAKIGAWVWVWVCEWA